MDALKNLLDNEKGLVALMILIGATIFVIIGKMTVEDWKTFSTWVFGIYAGTTAIHQSAVAMSNKEPSK